MKKIIIALALFALPLVTHASIDKNLYYGLKNDAQVVELQEFLIDNGYLSGSATGNFFSLTLKGVKKFQADNGLPKTGFVGTLTRAEINKRLALGLAESEEELAKEPTPSVNPTMPLAVPTIPTVTPAIPTYTAPTIQEPIQPTIESPKPTKEIIVIQEPKGDCVTMKVFVNGEDGNRIYGSHYQVKITVNTLPNYHAIVNLTSDTNEYTYCKSNAEEKPTVNFYVGSFGLTKNIAL